MVGLVPTVHVLRFKKEDVDARPEAGMTLVDSVLADNSE
jgi:hypothetical protein